MSFIKKICIVGTGLIGGSLAIRLREKNIASKIIGVDKNEMHAQEAFELNLIDEIKNLDEAVKSSEVIFLAIPVDKMEKVLPQVLDLIDQQMVIDVGSTKERLIEVVKNHPKRSRYVAAHPMWGTEFSGPKAAVQNAFQNRPVILCNMEDTDADARDWAIEMFEKIGMQILQMDAVSHDLHAAYVSHISHITSFALANTVLEKEKEEDKIFQLAGGGFESTVRLAKSNADMWVPIFKQNRSNVLDVLNEQIHQLKIMKKMIELEQYDALRALIIHANEIARILK